MNDYIKKEKVSVIVPVYNVKKTLEICVNSICNQTYNNLEIILVDDGSTDGSSEICDELQKRDNRIKVFHKSNGGLSDARNYGIKHSNGNFLVFVDSDDIIHLDFCSILYDALVSSNSDVVSANLIRFSNYDDIKNLKIDLPYRMYHFNNYELIKEYLSPKNKRIIFHSVCFRIYKRKVFDEIEFEKGKLHEDLFITYKLLLKCELYSYIDLPLYFCYENTTSITHTYNSYNYICEYEAIMNIYNDLSKYNRFDNYLLIFLFNFSLELLDRGRKLKDSVSINTSKKLIKICNDNLYRLPFFNKIKYFLFINNIFFYHLLLKLKVIK